MGQGIGLGGGLVRAGVVLDILLWVVDVGGRWKEGMLCMICDVLTCSRWCGMGRGKVMKKG